MRDYDYADIVQQAGDWRRRMQYDLDMAAIKGTIDEMSIYFETEEEVRKFKLWAIEQGYTNPITDLSTYFDTSSVQEKAKVNRNYDRIVLMEFLYHDEIPDWHFEVRTYLGNSVIPEYLQVDSGSVLFGSFKCDWERYDQTVAALGYEFGSVLRMFESRYGVCSDTGEEGMPPYYHARTRSPNFSPWMRK